MALGAVAVLIAVYLGAGFSPSVHSFVSLDLPLLMLPFVAWLFLSERYELTMAVFMLYLGLFDGVVKLSSGSELGTVARDVVLYAIVAGAVARWVLRRERLTLPREGLIVIAWVLICVVQIPNPGDSSMLHAAVSLRQDLEFVPLFFFGYFIVRDAERLQRFELLLVFVAAVNGVVSLIQSRLTPEQLASWGPGYRDLELGGGLRGTARVFYENGHAYVRPPGLGGTDGFAGILCALALPCILALAVGQTRPLVRAGLAAALPFVVIGIVSSETRDALVSAGVGVVAFAGLTVTSRRGLISLGVISVLLAVTVLLAGSYLSGGPNRFSTTDNGRGIQTRAQALALVPSYLERFPLGDGLGSVGPAGALFGGTKDLSGENQIVFTIVEAGIPGLAVISLLFAMMLRIGFRLKRIEELAVQRPLMAMVAGWWLLLSEWVSGPVTANSPPAPFIWFTAGVLAYWISEVRAGRVVVSRNALRASLA